MAETGVTPPWGVKKGFQVQPLAESPSQSGPKFQNVSCGSESQTLEPCLSVRYFLASLVVGRQRLWLIELA